MTETTLYRLDKLFGYVEMILPEPWIYWPVGAVLFTEPFYVLPQAIWIEHDR